MPMLNQNLSEEFCKAYIKAYKRGAVSDETLFKNCEEFMRQLKEKQLFPLGYSGHTTDEETVEGALQYHNARIGDKKFFADYGWAELVEVQAPKKINDKYRFRADRVDNHICKTYQILEGALGYDC